MWARCRAFRDHPATVREPWTAAGLVEQHACHPPAVAPRRPDGTARTTSCGRRCLFRSTAEARHTAGCPRVEELVSEVGSQSWPSGPAPPPKSTDLAPLLCWWSPPILGLSRLFPAWRAVDGRCGPATPGLVGSTVVRLRACACARVCVWVPRCHFCFFPVGCCHHQPRDANRHRLESRARRPAWLRFNRQTALSHRALVAAPSKHTDNCRATSLM